MNGPDGPTERDADRAEKLQSYYESLDRTERYQEESVDEALLDLAQARMTGWFIDRVLA